MSQPIRLESQPGKVLANRSGRTAKLVAIVLIQVYCVGVLSWAATYVVFGDRWWWLFLINSVVFVLFMPLPLLLPAALLLRRPDVRIGSAAVLLVGTLLYAPLFLPRLPIGTANGPTLTVMTYNLLGTTPEPRVAEIVSALRRSNADVIAIQELTPAIATAIQSQLGQEYPYQALDPHPGVAGMGLLSRYPLRASAHTLGGKGWVGTPQALELTVDGVAITVVNFHTVPTIGGSTDELSPTTRLREAQAQALHDFVKQAEADTPVIVLGDLNATDLSTAYKRLTPRLLDAWRQAGWGFGNTWPGAASNGSGGPPGTGSLALPRWVTRVDYVFHSLHWQADTAWIGPWDGRSDHRPVVAQLTLLINPLEH